MSQLPSFLFLAITIVCVFENILQVQGQLSFNWRDFPPKEEFDEPMNQVR